MSHALHEYLAGQLDKLLRDHRVVVFYDSKGELGPFFDELEAVGTGLGDLPRMGIGDTLTHLARFEGSFFALKAAVEPVVQADRPEPLLIYLPEVERDREGSVLMELELAGSVYGDQPAHSLRSSARRLLRKQFTDGVIDDMLKPEALTYRDVIRFLEQGDSGAGSLVQVVLGGGSSEELITRWVGSDQYDRELEAKGAEPELYKLVNARLGLQIGSDTALGKARHQALRYVLVNEFRSDLGGPSPSALSSISEPGTQDETQRIRTVAGRLRKKHGVAYIALADGIELEFDLANVEIDPATLGAIDTFRFEEQRLLGYAASLVADGNHAKALAVAAGRGRSFWVDGSHFLDRYAQWEACRLTAELGQRIQEVRPQVQKMAGPAGRWVRAYSDEGGWYRLDQAQRELEAWLSKMEDEPEASLEKAVGWVRRNHEILLDEMAKGFTQAQVNSGWSSVDVMPQTAIYRDFVEGRSGRMAYFWVDALRYEMGAELVKQLEGAEEVRLQPALGVLPSITPLGMAALLPGASGSFSVVEHKGALAAQIGDQVFPSVRERLRYLKAVRPDHKDISLDDLLIWSTARVAKKLGESPLILVRSQHIDAIGESGQELAARQIMDGIIRNLARAVRRLAQLGIEQFVITSDHGYQFGMRKNEDMLLDRPEGQEVDQHRRSWAGRGGQTPVAGVRVSAAELGYQSDLEFIFPRGVAIFKAGGDRTFHHGGCSLQELVLPVITLRMAAKVSGKVERKVRVTEYPTKLTNRTFGCRVHRMPDLFTQEPLAARVILLCGQQEVGHAGMAPGAVFNVTTATVQLLPGAEVSLGMMLIREDVKKVRIVIQDPATDAILGQSDDIEVGELI